MVSIIDKFVISRFQFYYVHLSDTSKSLLKSIYFNLAYEIEITSSSIQHLMYEFTQITPAFPIAWHNLLTIKFKKKTRTDQINT